MKTLLLIGSIIVLNASASLACTPPQYNYYQQKAVFSDMLASEDVTKAIIDVAGNAGVVTAIQANAKAGWDILLSTGCTVNVQAQYKKPNSPGMCPQFLGFTTTSACKTTN